MWISVGVPDKADEAARSRDLRTCGGWLALPGKENRRKVRKRDIKGTRREAEKYKREVGNIQTGPSGRKRTWTGAWWLWGTWKELSDCESAKWPRIAAIPHLADSFITELANQRTV
jgi:sugar phosphate isomerase/epimerase